MDRSTEKDTESLLQKLRERDEELLQAGKYGKSMLETNSHLESLLQQMNDEYEKKIENLEQQKFSLEVKVEALKNAADQETIASTQEKQIMANKHHSEIEAIERQHKIGLSEINLKVANLQKELDESTLIKQQLHEKLDKQQVTISELRSALEKQSLASDSVSPYVVELSQENVKLKEERDSHLEQCNDMRHYIEQLSFQAEELQKSNEFLHVVKADLESEMRTCSDALEQCQMTNQNLLKELEELRLHPQDPSSKGNSLFAEVEDRRVQAEKRLISSQVKLNCLEKKYKQQLNYAMKLKAQIAQLLQSGGRDADRERISRLEQALASSQTDSKHLIDKVADLEAKLEAESFENISDKKQNSSSEEFAHFLQNLLKKKDAELKKLSDDLQKCHVDLLSESRRANEADLDVYAAQSERDKLKSQCLKLKMEVTRLKLKCGEEAQGKRQVKTGKIEKIPLGPLTASSQNIDGVGANNENEPIKAAPSDKSDVAASNPQLKSDLAVSRKEISNEQGSSRSALENPPQECRQQ